MNRWGPNTYKWAYRFLCIRDGEYCIICGPSKKNNHNLEIDHIDGDICNNEPKNLCLICKKHNCKMRGKKPSEHKRFIQRYHLKNEKERENSLTKPATQFTKEVIDYGTGSIEMQANARFEVNFREWIIGKVIIEGEFLKSDAIAAGAEEVGCSTVASRRYLEKLTSSSGPLYETKDAFGRVVIRLKQKG